MKLNKLSYRIIEPNDQSIEDDYFVDYEDFPTISFELLIDGETISDLLKTNNKTIHYYYFENDLPSYFHSYRNKEIHIIGVCSCGIDSCGSATCVLDKGEDLVAFREIFNGGLEFPKDFEFRFSRENYDSMIKEVIEQANKYKRNELEDEFNKENYERSS